MKNIETIGKLLKDYFETSNEPLAVAFRNYASQLLAHPDALADWTDGQEVMQLLHISPRTLQTLRTQRTLPFSRIGNKLYYKRSDIQRILEDNYLMYWFRNGKK